ncbi:crotonase/enoyl-CoA hydratase family protein [Rhodococcus triatomae]|uniref:Enoyl-CoA hydratase/carnithine racemase n=1 Tax=Rhodococcus triatomae TaxID=300028 RepID=A0A1G8QLL4_9NOCA|nr:crotonase/enoyl-CoA hydratase family protein [Rhodococcus triatomae]QNG21580.1 crotonase/enoyl-CoA hydratase family protein [Rhodococcus triatomae]QNG25681.1 crotonase/enoyl-CoA hydratase family protein [Rhodococcus triatomae]SDJ05689.1 Enoyl-CoA hydratase/carnithine racemase [Rhodococcus triatomae]
MPADPTPTEVITSTTDGHVTTWTLNLPEARNPISGPEMVDRLVELVADVNADPQTRVVILTGAGSAFSAGGNVKDMADRTGMFGGTPRELRDGYRRGIQRIPLALYDCEVPVIAAVNGPAVGAGCDLALMADMRIASTKAFFAESFVKLGIIPGDGGAWFLPRVIGPARAAEMAYTGDRVDAATALEWGLVSQVVEPEELLPAARALAARVAVNPPHTLRMTKKLLRQSEKQDLRGLLELSAALQAISHHTEDHREALDALLTKRTGTFTGH